MRIHHLDALTFACLLAGCTGRASDLEPPDDTGSTGSTSAEEASSTGNGETTGSESVDTTSAEAPESSTSSDESTGESDSTGATTGAATGFSVSGVVTRSVDPANGNDGVGTLYFAVVDSCGTSFDLVAAETLEDADTSAPVPYTVTDVPDGTWFMVVYLDDDGDAELPNPAPDSGDLVVSSGASIGCAEVTVDGADVDGIDLNLNFVLP